MRAVQFGKCGPAEVLQLVGDREQPHAGPGELLVRVRAAGLNPRDFKVRQSNCMRMSFGIALPAIPGNDIAGEVLEVGEGVSDFAIGDAVLAMLELRRPGAYAEYAVVSAKLAVKKPSVLDFHHAAALPLAGLTALQLLRRSGRLAEGKEILINGASGGVGSFATQIAKAGGAHVTAVTSARNSEFVRTLGADRVVDYTREEATSGGPFDAVIDTVGTVSFWKATNALKAGGAYASCDPSSGMLAAILSPFSRYHGYFVVVKPGAGDLADLVQLVEAGKLRPYVERVFAFDDVANAHRHLETNRTRGKVVLSIA